MGGMSSVYRANDLLAEGTNVAIKVFEAAKIKPGILRAVFARETQALKELTHDNIVRLLDEGVDAETGQQFLVFDWVEEDLESALTRTPISSWEVFETMLGFRSWKRSHMPTLGISFTET
jgi:serine/threonine protein kinase